MMSSDILSLQKSGNDVFIRKISAGEWVKFTPEKNGKYLISETVAGEDYTYPSVYDSELNQINGNEKDIYDLKKDIRIIWEHHMIKRLHLLLNWYLP